ncbi:MAG: hypothetical protein WDN25_11190 [Acetobacteraceae bacterium]
MHPHRIALATLLLATVLAGHARGDEVTDQINEALKAYQNQDVATAITALDAAANLLRQARAEALKQLLPPVPAGWTADDADATAIGAAMLGGGTTASRVYHNAAQRVEVQLLADSPMLQGMAALIGSPMAAGAMKTVVVNDRRMAYTENDRSYMTLIGGKVVVTVQGDAETPDAALRSFIAAIDFTAIEKLAR